MLDHKGQFQLQLADQAKSLDPIKSQMKHLKMHKRRRKGHFSQTMSYDLFCDDLCEEPTKVHA